MSRQSRQISRFHRSNDDSKSIIAYQRRLGGTRVALPVAGFCSTATDSDAFPFSQLTLVSTPDPSASYFVWTRVCAMRNFNRHAPPSVCSFLLILDLVTCPICFVHFYSSPITKFISSRSNGCATKTRNMRITWLRRF